MITKSGCDLSDLKKQISSAQLSLVELDDLVKYCQLLQGMKSDDEMKDWYQALSVQLASETDWQSSPYVALKPDFKKLLQASYLQLRQWLTASFKPPLTKTERLWAYHWCAELLVEESYVRNQPVCMATSLKQVQMLPQIIAREFPGYIQGGLLRFILSQKANKV
jgi:hypothetical protein